MAFCSHSNASIERKLCIHSAGNKGAQPRPFMGTILTDSHKAVLKIIYWRDLKGTVGKKVLWNQGVRTRLLRATVQMVIAVERCSCVEALHAEQFTRERISLGWSPGLHDNVQCDAALNFHAYFAWISVILLLLDGG